MTRGSGSDVRAVSRRLRRVWSELVDLLYPPRCEVCGADSRQPLCGSCVEAIERIHEPFCRRCNVPFAPWAGDPLLCGDCKRTRSRLIGVRSAGLHTSTLRAAVLRLKFDGARRLVGPLAAMMFEALAAEAERDGGFPVDEVEAIVPAVLHPARRRWRGFDQSVLLARALSELWGPPVVLAVVRQRPTEPQVDLGPQERRRNLAGAFVPARGVDVAGRTVVIVDDVYTTGATLEACAEALAAAGAARVYAVTVTRTAPPWHRAASDPDAVQGL